MELDAEQIIRDMERTVVILMHRQAALVSEIEEINGEIDDLLSMIRVIRLSQEQEE